MEHLKYLKTTLSPFFFCFPVNTNQIPSNSICRSDFFSFSLAAFTWSVTSFFLHFSWSGAKRQTKQVSKRTTKCWVEQLIVLLFHITLKIHPKKRFACFYYSMAFLPCNLWSMVTRRLCTAVCAPQCSVKGVSALAQLLFCINEVENSYTGHRASPAKQQKGKPKK